VITVIGGVLVGFGAVVLGVEVLMLRRGSPLPGLSFPARVSFPPVSSAQAAALEFRLPVGRVRPAGPGRVLVTGVLKAGMVPGARRGPAFALLVSLPEAGGVPTVRNVAPGFGMLLALPGVGFLASPEWWFAMGPLFVLAALVPMGLMRAKVHGVLNWAVLEPVQAEIARRVGEPLADRGSRSRAIEEREIEEPRSREIDGP